jgi:hypothetical protein
MRYADGASARAVLSVAADRPTSLPADGFLVVTGMSAVKRRTPSVVVREPRAAPMSAEERQQAVTALVAMIHEWWSNGQGRSDGAVGGSDQRGGATAAERSRTRSRPVTAAWTRMIGSLIGATPAAGIGLDKPTPSPLGGTPRRGQSQQPRPRRQVR